MSLTKILQSHLLWDQQGGRFWCFDYSAINISCFQAALKWKVSIPVLVLSPLLALNTKQSHLPFPASFLQALHSNFIVLLSLFCSKTTLILLSFSSLSVLWPFSAEDAHFQQSSHLHALWDYHRTAKSAERIREARAADREGQRELSRQNFPGQESRGSCRGSWASVALNRAQKPRGRGLHTRSSMLEW